MLPKVVIVVMIVIIVILVMLANCMIICVTNLAVLIETLMSSQ